MEQIVRADIAAFGAGRAEMANAMIEESGIRVRPDRNRGRSAGINPSGRFEPVTRHVFDDGWNSIEELPPFKTELQVEKPRTIITRNESPDISFDRSINPYRGCEHGCVYCFARPTHSFVGLSPGVDFESKLFAKPDAARLLDKELSKEGYQPRTIAIGTNTDPYQPVERDLKITRSVLEVLLETRHPLTMVTKNHLITRDIDILSEMARLNLVKCYLSVTSLDRKLARAMEPRASTPPRRIEAIRLLNEAGIPCGVMTAPMIPGLNDMELERILEAAYEAGAREAGYVLLRLPFELKEIWREWLQEHYPDRASKVMKLVQETRGGKDYEPEWGERQRGEGVYATLLAQRFRLAIRRLGFNEKRLGIRCDLFTPPEKDARQGRLF